MEYFQGLVGFCWIHFLLVKAFVEDVCALRMVGLVSDWSAAGTASWNRQHFNSNYKGMHYEYENLTTSWSKIAQKANSNSSYYKRVAIDFSKKESYKKSDEEESSENGSDLLLNQFS